MPLDLEKNGEKRREKRQKTAGFSADVRSFCELGEWLANTEVCIGEFFLKI